MRNGKCFLYCRQSSGQEDSNNSTSISQQLENCRELARRSGLEIADIFTDANVSGKTYPAGAFFEKIAESDPGFQKWFLQQTSRKKYRPGLGALLSRLDEVEYIVVDEITRLHRSAGASFLEQTINFTITESHVKILQVKGGMIDLSRFDQNLIQILRTQINDEQISNQKKKSLESRVRLKDSGLIGDAKFYGGVYDGNRHFHFEKGCIPVIRFVFQSILKQSSYREVSVQLNHHWQGLSKGRCFYESTICNIARQPVYSGLMYNSSGELIKCRNAPEPIIAPAEFLEVQKIMEERRRIRASPRCEEKKHHYLPLSGFLKCGYCGGRMQVNIDRGKIFYICRNAVMNKTKACRSVRILDEIEGKNTAGLRQALMPLVILGIEQAWQRLNEMQFPECNAAKLELQIKKLDSKLATAFQVFREDIIDEETYVRITKEAAGERKKLRLKRKEIEVCGTVDLKEEIRKLNTYSDSLLQKNDMDGKTRVMLLQKSLKEVFIFSDRIDIHTVSGNFTLPRLVSKQKRRLLPIGKIEKITQETVPKDYFEISYEIEGNKKILLKTVQTIITTGKEERNCL